MISVIAHWLLIVVGVLLAIGSVLAIVVAAAYIRYLRELEVGEQDNVPSHHHLVAP